MIRFAWLQSRTHNLIALAALAAVAVGLALTGPHLVDLYNKTVGACIAQGGDCTVTTNAFLRTDNSVRTWLSVLVIIVPGIVGIFWGAPLVAREIETGTHRLVWTQSVTRTRWLAVKLGVVGLASMAVAGLLSLAVTWWASPLDRAAMTQYKTFDQRDLVAVGYAAFAFILGVTAGVVIRRTLPAMATALALFAGVRLAVTEWVRPDLLTASHTTVAVTSAGDLGFTGGASGVSFVASNPSIPNAWVLSSHLVDQAGQPASPHTMQQFLQTACPDVAHPPTPPSGVTRAPAPLSGFNDCVTHISEKFHLAVTYQPANHYWALQWYETAIFLTGGLILAGFCFWWIRRRHT